MLLADMLRLDMRCDYCCYDLLLCYTCFAIVYEMRLLLLIITMLLVLRLAICSAITDVAVYCDAIGIAIDYAMRLLLLFVMMRLVL
jgi:hypothetical protein